MADIFLYCRGVVILGLGASETELKDCFELASKHDLCKGFAVGRSIFQEAAERWFAGEIDDNKVVLQIANKYTRLLEMWSHRR